MNVVKAPSQDLQQAMRALGHSAREAAGRLALANTDSKNHALNKMAGAIRADKARILEANTVDMAEAKAKGLSGALLDRLMMDDKRVEAMAKGLEEIAALPDPVGRTLAEWDRPNGLK